jgi:hypothetical protein
MRVSRLAEGEREEHRRPGRDLTGEQSERGTAWRSGAQRGECAHGRSVDQEERAETADADAGVFENIAASVGAPLGHNRVADVEDAVGVVQTGSEKHSPEREGGGYTRRHDVGRQ